MATNPSIVPLGGIAEYLEENYFEPEAIKAYHEGRFWEYKPESTECGDQYPYWCDSCDRWHLQWLVTGFTLSMDYEAEEMRLYHTYWTVDESNDWSDPEMMDMSSEEYPNWYNTTISFEETKRLWARYYRSCVATGEDPLESVISFGKTRDAYWKVEVRLFEGNFYLMGARDRRGHDGFRRPEFRNFPKYITEYMCAVQIEEPFFMPPLEPGGMPKFLGSGYERMYTKRWWRMDIEGSGITDMESLRRIATDVEWSRGAPFKDEVARGILKVPTVVKISKAEIVAAAKRALQEDEKLVGNMRVMTEVKGG